MSVMIKQIADPPPFVILNKSVTGGDGSEHELCPIIPGYQLDRNRTRPPNCKWTMLFIHCYHESMFRRHFLWVRDLPFRNYSPVVV